jgi:hypothetical protein
VEAAQKGGLKAIICIGEQLQDREGGKTNEVGRLKKYPVFCSFLVFSLGGVAAAGSHGCRSDRLEPHRDCIRARVGHRVKSNLLFFHFFILFLRTGKTATPAIAQAVHATIREWLVAKIGAAASSVRIIYGGSVNPGNCEALAAEADINGFLVGGASLKAETFLPIIKSKSGKSNL